MGKDDDNASAIRIFHVDAFAAHPFEGNPAAVCLIPTGKTISEAVMQKIAFEMNLSETAFVSRVNPDNSQSYNLRWFTPEREVPLCGHATMASAAALIDTIGSIHPSLSFHTLSGELIVKQDGKLLAMDLPQYQSEEQDTAPLANPIRTTVGDLPVKACHLSRASRKLIIHLADSVTRQQLEAMNPDTTAMRESHTEDLVRGVIVTLDAKGRYGEYHFLSRYFAPWVGIPEDPVTGSAHALLSTYWGKLLGTDAMLARQCSKRGGDVRIRLLEKGRVEIAGEAKILTRGVLSLE
eukprot:m.195469 g.195469  ORF g.195469 m.195469 type:complete len:294 (+) comp17637_c0_seq4:41-922(+)